MRLDDFISLFFHFMRLLIPAIRLLGLVKRLLGHVIRPWVSFIRLSSSAIGLLYFANGSLISVINNRINVPVIKQLYQ